MKQWVVELVCVKCRPGAAETVQAANESEALWAAERVHTEAHRHRGQLKGWADACCWATGAKEVSGTQPR